MHRLRTGLWGLMLCWGAQAAVAAAQAPTIEALLAEQDVAMVKSVVAWSKAALELPDDLVLEPALRDAVDQMVRDHVQRLRTLVPAWIAEERAAQQQPALRGEKLARPLYLRLMNEMAIATVESAGSAQDAAWLKAALAPAACKFLPSGLFARRIAMIQAAPEDSRAALLAAEKELLSRWGQPRPALAPRPASSELVAAEHAVTQLRNGLPAAALPMAPFLAAQVFARGHAPGKPDRWEQCARSQWWLQSQLADDRADRAKALTVYRYSTMLDATDFIPAGYKPKPNAPAADPGKPPYPRAANYFHVEGLVTIRVHLDGQGKATQAEVVARQVQVPGVHSGRVVAFETLLDDAALDYARQRSYPTGKTGVAQFEMQWNLDKDSDEAQ